MTAMQHAVPARKAGSLGGRWLCAAFGLASLGGGLWLAAAYPLAFPIGVALFCLWAAAVFLQPAAWLLLIPAVLPWLGFASWSGWLIFEELDVALLGAAGGGYLRLAFAWTSGERTHRHRVSLLSVVLLFLFFVSLGVALARGVADAGGWHFSWDQGYDDPLNSLRLFKSFFLALLLTPLLHRELERSETRTLSLLSGGLALGLGGAALAALWERLAFPGLLNFSSDYRTTGLFWEMHVGGAALDGFLALTLPFALRELLAGHSRWRWALSGALLLLAAYVCLTTFSRGVYLALAVALGMIAVLLSRQAAGGARAATATRLLHAALFALAAGAAFLVFRAGGYRSLLAILGVVALMLPLGVMLRGATPLLWGAALGGGGLLAGGGIVFALLLPKGPYVVYALAFALCFALLALYRRGGAATLRGAALAAYVWTAIAAAHVAFFWGGIGALADSALVLAGLLLLCPAAGRYRLWPVAPRAQAAVFAGVVMLAGAVAVFTGGGYMTGRFAGSERDLGGRMVHWSKGLALLQSPADWLLGKGLGRFPASYFYGAHGAEFPGSYKIGEQEGNRFLALSGPRHMLGFGELFRIAQRVPVVAGGAYVLDLDVRVQETSRLHLEICEKHLLYSEGCTIKAVDIRPGPPGWQHVAVRLDAGRLSGGPWYAPRLAFLSLAVDSHGRVVEIDNVGLSAPGASALLANGDFSAGMERWFFTSDRHHLPWHIKSMFLHVLFEQGAVGLLLFVALFLGALWRLLGGAARAHPVAPYLAASLAGFAVVGVFDSLLDVPRVGFLFYFMTIVALLLRPRRSGTEGVS